MKTNRKILIAGAAALALAAGGVGVAQAVGSGDDEERATGPQADRAAAAALKATGGGSVVGVEREDEGRKGWEVEVKRSDGKTVEVHIGTDFAPAGIEADDDGAGDRVEAGDDD